MVNIICIDCDARAQENTIGIESNWRRKSSDNFSFIFAIHRCIGSLQWRKKLQCVHFLREFAILSDSAALCSVLLQNETISSACGHDKNGTHTHIDYVLYHLDLSLALLLCSTRKLFNANEKKIALFFVCVREKIYKVNNMKKENALKTQRTFDLYRLV